MLQTRPRAAVITKALNTTIKTVAQNKTLKMPEPCLFIYITVKAEYITEGTRCMYDKVIQQTAAMQLQMQAVMTE